MEKAFKQSKIEFWMNYCDLSEKDAELLYEQYSSIENAKKSINNAELAEWAQKIKGVIRHKGVLYWAAECDILISSFSFRNNFTEVADGLVLVKEIETYHDYQYSNIPTPSLGDVIKQIPKELLESIAAVEIVVDYKNETFLNKLLEKHVLKTRLYTGVLPKSISEAVVICDGKKYEPKKAQL